jgi:hypothetical protein
MTDILDLTGGDFIRQKLKHSPDGFGRKEDRVGFECFVDTAMKSAL